eukprot:761022-Hanusia_phi.AAC.2
MADYQGIQLVKRLSHLSDKAKQRAEVSVYFKRFDEAEKLYKDMDRLDLAIDMRATLGDWHKVMNLAGQGGGSDVLLKTAYTNVGDYYFDRQMWSKANGYYEMAGVTEKQIECLYNMEDYNTMAQLASDPEKQLPEGSSSLLVVGERLASVGLADEAVAAFLRANDVKAAIDCCVLLNKWDKAIQLAEEHDFPQIEGLLSKYATHLLGTGKRMEAIELYRKANRHPEAAKLLAEIAQEVVKSKANPQRARQLYVLAALEVEKFREKTLKVQQPGTTTTAGTMAGKTTMGRATMGGVRNTQATLATLDGLMQGDAISAENKILDQAWRGVEALDMYLEAHELLYKGQVNKAMQYAESLAKYDDILDAEDIFSLIALTSFHNNMYAVCSNAFMRLEQLESLPKERREQFQDLAFKIFTRYKPKDISMSKSAEQGSVTSETVKAIRRKFMQLCQAGQSGRETERRGEEGIRDSEY